MHWILTFILGFIAGVVACVVLFCWAVDRVEAQKRQGQVDTLTGKKSGGD